MSFFVQLVPTHAQARAVFDKQGPGSPLIHLKSYFSARIRWICIILLVVALRWESLRPQRLFVGLFLFFLFRWSLWLYRCLRVWKTNQFDAAPDIRKSSSYQDEALLKEAWSSSAAGRRLGGRLPLFQPKEGFCGYATVNATIQSIDPKLELLHYELAGRHVSLSEMNKLLSLAFAKSSQWQEKIRNYQCFSAEHMTLPEFHEHVRLSLREEFRYMMIFHRAPLFFNDWDDKTRQTKRGLQQFFAAHWSPLLGLVERDGQSLVLVGDVNESYNAWLCPLDRLYASIRNRSFIDNGEWRGLIRFNLTAPSSVSSADESILFKEDAAEKFILNKSAYYSAVADSCNDGFMWKETSGDLTSYGHPGCVPFFKMIINDNPDGAGKVRSVDEWATLIEPLLHRYRRHGSLVNVLLKPQEPHLLALKEACIRLCRMIPIGSPQGKPKSLMWLRLKKEVDPFSVHKDYHIRELTAADRKNSEIWHQFAYCVCQAYPWMTRFGSVETLVDDFQHFFHSSMEFGRESGLRLFVAEEIGSNKLAGSVVSFIRPGETAVGSMYNVTVLPEHKRRGLGRALTMTAIKALTESKIKYCVLQASPHGRPLYEKLGFEAIPSETSLIKISFANGIGFTGMKYLAYIFEVYISMVGALDFTPLLHSILLISLYFFV